ncbi:phospholipase A [Vibrio sp. YYF0003]|uniref:phospholipase A n=1 Tax=Vibrio sp. YYF0003 TaxID=3116646 RepID=UPI002EB0DFF3|nr:phospholipase A [Vibrio sp. YYF0003]
MAKRTILGIALSTYACFSLAQGNTESTIPDTEATDSPGGVTERYNKEQSTMFDPFVITPYEMNYILPVLYTSDINQEAYRERDWFGNLKDTEAKYQLSFKVPLSTTSIFLPGDRFFFGFTLRSWWQLYAGDISRPFRETNYQPTVFYVTPIETHLYGYHLFLGAGVKHSSNGQSGELSRSWNYVYGSVIAEKGNLAFRLKPWIRLSENKDDDDNPDLLDYMGHFEAGMVYKYNSLEFKFIGRNNFSEHHGYAEIGMTFPFLKHLKGYIQYSNGYGESLIDYNHSQQRIGIGIALTDML